MSPLEQQAPHGAHSGKHKRHGVNVQVVADPAGRLIWTSPALPGARHDMGAAREHGILTALANAGVRVIDDNAYRGAGTKGGSAVTPSLQGSRNRSAQAAVGESESRQLRPRRATRARRARERAVQKLEDPPQDPLEPHPRHPARQRHPDPHPRRLNPSEKRSVTVTCRSRECGTGR